MLRLSVLVLSGALLVPVADETPRWDIAGSCRASTGAADGTGERYAACVRDETAARDQVSGVWTLAKAPTRATCVGAQSQGTRSFVALLTCMQIAEPSLPWKK